MATTAQVRKYLDSIRAAITKTDSGIIVREAGARSSTTGSSIRATIRVAGAVRNWGKPTLLIELESPDSIDQARLGALIVNLTRELYDVPQVAEVAGAVGFQLAERPNGQYVYSWLISAPAPL